MKEGLIDYRAPFWFVKNISGRKKNRIEPSKKISEKVPSDPEREREYGKKCIQDILKKLSKNCKE